ncbi:alpha/beta-hydrolase [Gymnopus androsaceus JB14]|uniref:acylaminoacyl-peptidase n=1 Tax=Gymnopus androsaceus JB14 TaxID=1447944 RepID=A0A6A4HRU7_9AGAR|nr:alpha/beta-hydrolase [Gymnopus androsaceus JB14]
MSMDNYDELTAIPVPTLAFLHETAVEVQCSVRDHARNVKRTLSKSISLDTGASTPSVEVIGIISTAYSPSGNLKATLRETDDKKRFVEIWNNDIIVACKDVTDEHGIFYADDFFSSLCFSPSEKSILYVAEKKKPTEKNSVEKFRYTQRIWRRPCGKIQPSALSAIFGPTDDNKIFATGYETAPGERLLGIKACYNHPMGIWELDIERRGPEWPTVRVRKLTPPHLSCRSPRIITSNGKTTLLWISESTGGAHASTASLHSLDIALRGEFPGLYLGPTLHRNPHVHFGKDDYIVVQTCWGSRGTIVPISLHNGAITELTPVGDKILLSWTDILAVAGNKVVCSRSSFTGPSELVLGEFDGAGSVSWKVIHKPVVSERLQTCLDSLTVKVVPIPERFPTETILVQHRSALREQKILPCITIPHGGPHGAETIALSASTVCLALEGYTISLPNYTGSTGFGEKHVRALIGQCGTLDVGDCIESVRYLVKTGVAVEGPGKLFLSGGSHGGFLLGHLIGQYPNVFTAAVLRNPVISAGEVSTSDIQDWYFAEFGLDYPLPSLPLGYTGLSSATTKASPSPPQIITPEVYSKLFHASPIAHVQTVTAAVLLLIGDSDQRVAPTQGIGYYHALKALKADCSDDVEMLVFGGEGHPLDGLEASKVVWLRTAEWFKYRAIY